MKNVKYSLKRLKGILLILGVLLSCSTFKPSYDRTGWIGTLPDENFLIINSPSRLSELFNLVEIKIENNEITGLLESSEGIYGSFRTSRGEVTGYTIILVGSYPYARLNMGLSFMKELKRQDSPYIVFRHEREGYYFSCPNNFLIILSSEDPTSYIAGYRKTRSVTFIPESEKSLEEEVALYFPILDEKIIPPELPFNTKRIKIQESWIGLSYGDNRYVFRGGFRLEEEQDARIFYKTFKTFILAFMGEMEVQGVAGRLRKSDFDRDGTYIFFEGLEFSEVELKKGVEMFKENERE